MAGRTIDKSRAREIQMRYAPIAVTVLTCADWDYYAILQRCDYLRCTPYPPSGILRTVSASYPCLPRTTNPNQASKHPASATGTADLESLTRISPSLSRSARNSQYQTVRGRIMAQLNLLRDNSQAPYSICICGMHPRLMSLSGIITRPGTRPPNAIRSLLGP